MEPVQPPPEQKPPPPATTNGRQGWSPRDYTVVILAVAVGTGVNFIVIAVMYDAIQQGAEISDNAVQLLSVIFGGLIGLLASYVGFVSGRRSQAGTPEPPGEQPREPPPP